MALGEVAPGKGDGCPQTSEAFPWSWGGVTPWRLLGPLVRGGYPRLLSGLCGRAKGPGGCVGLSEEVLSGEGIDVRGGQEEWNGEGKVCVLFCRLLCPSLSPPAPLFCTQGPHVPMDPSVLLPLSSRTPPPC